MPSEINPNQTPRMNVRRSSRSTPFIPPKDGLLVKVNDGTILVDCEVDVVETRIGKRLRSYRTQSIPKSDPNFNSMEINTTTTITTLDANQVSAPGEKFAANSGRGQVTRKLYFSCFKYLHFFNLLCISEKYLNYLHFFNLLYISEKYLSNKTKFLSYNVCGYGNKYTR